MDRFVESTKRRESALSYAREMFQADIEALEGQIKSTRSILAGLEYRKYITEIRLRTLGRILVGENINDERFDENE